MQNARRFQRVQLINIQLEGAGFHLIRCGDIHQRAQRRTARGNAVMLAQTLQIDVFTVIAKDHRQTGQPAFGSFGLNNLRHPVAPAKVQAVSQLPYVIEIH